MNRITGRIKPCQIILHIPHSSTYIPDHCRKLFLLDRAQMEEESLWMTDSYTDELFEIPHVPTENRIVFPYSRLICDVERFRDDRLEIMAERGMGICYSVTSGLKPLKQITEDHRKEMLRLYDRHHAVLSVAVDRIIKRFGTGLLIDCHSFASKQLPYETDSAAAGKNMRRPDICIGTDPGYHTPEWLTNGMTAAFIKRGYSVQQDYPFNGTLVPMRYYHQDMRLLSVMVEVNRELYMDEATGKKTARFETVRTDIADVIAELLAGDDWK